MSERFTVIRPPGYSRVSREVNGRLTAYKGSLCSLSGNNPTLSSFSFQRDTLQTMAACFPVYGSALAHGSARKLWSSLKLEVRII